jgi:mannosyltransferase OCH1-like enzyme
MEFYRPTSADKNISALAMFPMYVINLDSSTSRMDHIIDEFKRYGVRPPTRIPAVDGRGVKDTHRGVVQGVRYDIRYGFMMTPMTGPELGCTLSHLKAISKAYEEGHEMALVLEDDVSLELIPHMDISIKELVEHANKKDEDWEMLHLSAMSQEDLLERMTSPLTLWTGDSVDKHDLYYTTGYLVHNRGMKMLLNKFMPRKDTVVIYRENTNKKLQSYSSDHLLYAETKTLVPNRVFFVPFNNHEKMDSMIHTDHTGGHINQSLEISRRVLLWSAREAHPPRRVVHQVWFHFDNKSPKRLEEMKPLRQTCLDANPDWEFHLWNEHECLRLVEEHVPSFLKTYKAYRHTVCRVDAMKYVLAYLFGGVAMDMDILCFKTMDTIIKHYDMVLTRESKDNICNDFVYASRPRHPFLKFVLDKLSSNKKPSSSKSPVELTGPRFLQSCYDKFNRHLPGSVHIVPFEKTHPFAWNDYKNICHSKNPRFQLSECMEQYRGKEPTFLTVYKGSWL